MHYCDGCNADSDDDDDHDEWCCGGDGACIAVEETPPCVWGLSHDWERYGGCESNPGVWSLGGTTLQYRLWCRYCGARKIRTEYGWQRSPGQCDRIRYLKGEPEPGAAENELRRQRRNSLARR
jgi:hypothetical protein